MMRSQSKGLGLSKLRLGSGESDGGSCNGYIDFENPRITSDDFLKNEATDLYENKGSAPVRARNEATDAGLLRVGKRITMPWTLLRNEKLEN